jgi:hypothetical protein
MPAASFVDSSHRVVVTICSGALTLADLKSTFAEICGNPEFRPNFRQLIDLSKVSKCPLYARDLYQLKQAHDPFSNKGKRALVAPHGVLFGIGRMYQQILSSPQVEVFHLLVEAASWLELNTAILEIVEKQSALSQQNLTNEGTLLDVPPDAPAARKRLRKGSTG